MKTQSRFMLSTADQMLEVMAVFPLISIKFGTISSIHGLFYVRNQACSHVNQCHVVMPRWLLIKGSRQILSWMAFFPPEMTDKVLYYINLL